MSIKNLYPETKPSLLLDFANTKSLDPRITFSRASGATYYDGKTVAKAEENLLIRSQEFDQSPWADINATITANTATAPDGTTTADTITDNATSSAHVLSQQVRVEPEINYAFSVFAQAGTHDFISLVLLEGINSNRWVAIVADLSVGTISQTATGVSGTLVSSDITDFGNGWYRIELVGNLDFSATGLVNINFVPAASGNTFGGYGRVNYSGTGTTLNIWGAQLEQRDSVTAYTPTTTQPITNYIPVLQTASANEPRFDHDPATGESLGLLIEEQRTNLLPYSENFSRLQWNANGLNKLGQLKISPDGNLSGYAFEDIDGSPNTPFVEFDVNTGFPIAGKTFCVSCYVYSDEDFASLFRVRGLGSVTEAENFAYTIPAKEWVRVSFTKSFTSSADGNLIKVAPVYTGDAGSKRFYIWGAQVEEGPFPTSYIKTEGSQVTRSADSASMTGTNFSDWYRQDEGAVYIEAASYSTSISNQFFLNFSDGTTNNRMGLTRAAANISKEVGLFARVNNISQVALITDQLGGLEVNEFGKLSGTYKFNDFAFCAKSGTVLTDSSGIMPTVNQLQIGGFIASGLFPINGHIRKIAYYPQRLANEQLQALTS